MTPGAVTPTITATGNHAGVKNRRSEPSILPASTCHRCWLLRFSVGYPPRSFTTAGIFVTFPTHTHTRSGPTIARDRVASTVSPP